MKYSLCIEINNFLRKVTDHGFNQISERYLHALFDGSKVVPGTLKFNSILTKDGEKFVFSVIYGKNGRADIWLDKDNVDAIKEINIFTDGELISILRNSITKTNGYDIEYGLLIHYYDAKACRFVIEQLNKEESFTTRILSDGDFTNYGLYQDAGNYYRIDDEDAIKNLSAIPKVETIIEEVRSKAKSKEGNDSGLDNSEYTSNLRKVM